MLTEIDDAYSASRSEKWSTNTHAVAIPKHIACIMDGNGRWARSKGLARMSGHAAGEKAVLEFIDLSLEFGISWVSLFSFSTENWTRSTAEVAFLMQFNSSVISRHGPRFHALGIRVRYLGIDDQRIPRELWRQMRDIEKVTIDNTRMTLTMAFNHGGRAELVESVQRIVKSGASAQDISEESIAHNLTYPDTPDPDLVIRTAGEYRLSNFALWRCAYSELIFSDTLWPDFARHDFVAALEEYGHRTRTFGKVPDVLRLNSPD